MSAGPRRADASVARLAADHDALLCTLLRWDPASEDLVRTASSRPQEYPVGGSKHFDRPWPTWLEDAVTDRRPHAADGAGAVREAFFDHELIAALGCAGYCTVPLTAQGRVVGVLSALGPEGWATPARLAALQRDVFRHPDRVAMSSEEEER